MGQASGISKLLSLSGTTTPQSPRFAPSINDGNTHVKVFEAEETLRKTLDLAKVKGYYMNEGVDVILF